MHCNIASCSAILFSEKVAYSIIPLFFILPFPESLEIRQEELIMILSKIAKG